MKILGHRHTGILTHDFDQMIVFYTGLGFVLKQLVSTEVSLNVNL